MARPRRPEPPPPDPAAPPGPPPWSAAADRLLAGAVGRVRVVGACTPRNLGAELARLSDAWPRSGAAPPRFAYAPPPDHAELRRALEQAADELEREGELGAAYAARAREIALEAAICESAGAPGCWEAARMRYAPRDVFDAEADALAARWAGEARAPRAGEARLRSDDASDPASLVARMGQAIGARRLPFRVIVADIAPLAATGDGVIQVAGGRPVTAEDVARTVLHEIEGHAAPASRAASMPIGLFAIGTAWGADDQEGRALALERAAGFLAGARRRELALRHLAARSVERGAAFVDTVRLLEAAAAGASIGEALRITARVHRGGGLGREVVYLPALLRVEAALRLDPALAPTLGSGRVSVGAAALLACWTGSPPTC